MLKYFVNKKFIESELNTLSDKITDNLEDAISNSELIILGNNEPYYDNLNEIVNQNKVFYELSKYKGTINCPKEGICWK